MKDYSLILGSGKSVLVSNLETEEIHDLIRIGVEVNETGITEKDVIERLHLELFIREHNLRDI